jgi:glycosyltransferase involved in cell wall biosynthesis
VEVKNSIELAEAIDKMVGLSSLELQRMGEAGREKVIDQFSQTKVIEKYFSLLKILGFTSENRLEEELFINYNKRATV